MDSDSSSLTPLVLLVDDQEKTSATLDEMLRPRGHVVLKAFTGRQAISLISKVSPDVILVDVDLPDVDGIELVRRLRGSSTVYPTTPILSIANEPLGRVARLEALSAGAWDILTHPIDGSELILRMETLVRAKQDADRVRDEGTSDPTTGFYNVRGILKRAREINADAVRFSRPLTCIAFGAVDTGDGPKEPQRVEFLGRPIAEALREVVRVCDTVGRLGPGEFVVVAPGTDGEGALRLADRVLEAISSGAERTGFGVADGSVAQIRAGIFSLDAGDRTSPEDLLLRATTALRRAQSEDGSFRIRAYDA